MEGFKVRCCTCGQVMYETTEFYNCHQPLTGDMLRLLPLYKDWPTYDGALACESTPRFLMFCSNCAGYISADGELTFADFPYERVTRISEERSRLANNLEFYEKCLSDKNSENLDQISNWETYFFRLPSTFFEIYKQFSEHLIPLNQA